MNSSFAAIGLSLSELESRYGAVVEIDRYRPDLYPTSYIFRVDDAELNVTLLGERAVHLTVAFKKAPKAFGIPQLLQRYSGVSEWAQQPTTDDRFAKHFPMFSVTDPRNTFFVSSGASVFALVQRDVANNDLMLTLSTKDYLNQLDAYRKQQSKGAPE